ncbi:ATP-binding cassette domain-containing protein [Microbacterium enclense]|uniref:ATP-binding cassette domain-containing protein n=1 Tax=Microbacterium enclense TaxID=993073 RepID=UPI003D73E7E7
MSSSIEISDLSFAYGGQPPLFCGLQAQMRGGESWALTGPSGSGKSTLLGLIAGWEQPSSGAVKRVGVNRTAWIFQNPHGQPHRAAVDHVMYPLAAAGSSRAHALEEATYILDLFGLADVAERAFATLSGGEAQRLMLARAVATKADLLLVDEPTAQLDRVAAEVVNGVLRHLAVRGAIVIVATHDAQTVSACEYRLDLEGLRRPDASPTT